MGPLTPESFSAYAVIQKGASLIRPVLETIVGGVVKALGYEGITESFPGRMTEEDWLKANPAKTLRDYRKDVRRRQKEWDEQKRRKWMDEQERRKM